ALPILSATSKHFGKSPEHISIAELKEYLFHRVEVGKLSTSGVNQTISAFKILFKDVLHRSWDPVRIKRPRRPKPLPTVFSKEEISLILKGIRRSEEHTSELQSREKFVCRLLLEKKNIRHN